MKILAVNKSFNIMVILWGTFILGFAAIIVFIGGICQVTAVITEKQPEPPLFEDRQLIMPDTSTYLFFEVNFVYRPQAENVFKPLTPGSVLHSGDYYKIIFTSQNDTYVYVFQIDSAGKMDRLFPMESFGGVTVNNFNPVKSGQTYYLPAKDKSFILDQQTGTETIYFLASQKRDEMLEAPLQRRDQRNELAIIDQLLEMADKAKNNVSVASSEIARKITWQETGLTFSVLQQRLENLCDGCVFVITFTHQ
jgi:hypothetical protein